MILDIQFQCRRDAHEGVKANGLVAHERKLCIAITIMVVRLSVSALPININASTMVVGCHCSVSSGDIVETTTTRDIHNRMTYFNSIVKRLFRDYIYGASNCRCSIQGRATTSHHLYTLNHVRWNLFQAIHTIQC